MLNASRLAASASAMPPLPCAWMRLPSAYRHRARSAVRATAVGNASARLNLEFGRLALDEASFEYAAMAPRIQAIRRLGAEAGEDTQVQAAEWFRSSMLAGLDRLDEALEVAQAGLAAAQRDHQAWIAPRWEIWRGWLLLQQGQLPDASAAQAAHANFLHRAAPFAVLALRCTR